MSNASMAVKPDPAVTLAFLNYLYGGHQQGFLGITTFPGPRTHFFDLSQAGALEKAARLGGELAASRDVYFGTGLLMERLQTGRGAEKDVISIPGGWADADYLHKVHAATDLPPTPDDGLWLIEQFGLKPTVLVHTGHGWQPHWIFDQPWCFSDTEARAQARQFTDRLQAILRRIAAQRKWSMDNTSDLARLLRLPGSINFRDRTAPCLVTFEITGPRYDREALLEFVNDKYSGKTSFVGFDGFVAGGPFPQNGAEGGFEGFVGGGPVSERQAEGGFVGFEGFVGGGPVSERQAEGGFVGSEGFVGGDPFPEDATSGGPEAAGETGREDGSAANGAADSAGEPAADVPPNESGSAAEDYPPADIGPIVQGCAWMRHCHNDAKVLSEPEWYSMLTVVGRCRNGELLAHRWSRPYPNYSEKETLKKLEHALKDSGPITCQFVAERLGQTHLCSLCPHWGAISSPIVLGTRGQSATADGPWPKPQPLSAALPDVAVFDSRLLPPVLRDHVMDVAERLQVPADFPAATMVVSLAGAIGRRAVIMPMQHDTTWVVVPNLWGGIIGRPGLMKSPCIRAVMAPLLYLQSQAMAQHKADMEDYERELADWEARRASWKKRAIQGSSGGGFDEPKPEKPACSRFIVNDATVEKLHEILEENPQGVLYIRDELAGWLATLDTKGRERERPFFLESWNGDGSYTVDRIGRGTLHVEHLCLSVFGGIQPSRLQRYLTDAVTGGATDDGLAQRLQVLVWPDHSQEWQQVDRPANVEAAIAVEAAFRRITKMLIVDPFRARFAADAQELFNCWRADLERRVRRGTLGATLESHLAKYRKLMPALALIFHIAEGGGIAQVPLIQAQRAAAWCEYLESHARCVYSCVTSHSNRLAADLGSKLKQGVLGTKFRLRDAYLRGWAGLDTPEAVRMALAVLEDAGWVRRLDPKNSPQGGRPKEEYAVNPAVYHG